MDPHDPHAPPDDGEDLPDEEVNWEDDPPEPPPDPNPIEAAEAEELKGFEEEQTENGGRRMQNWQGGVVTVIILLILFGLFRSITMGNFAIMLACTIILIAVPLAAFVAFSGWRAGSAPKNPNKKEGK